MKFFIKAAVILGTTFLFSSFCSAAGYVGSGTCFKCHPDQYNDFIVSGHSYKLSRAEDAMKRPIPLPKGYSWDDISYVIGGKYKKSRYIDNNGYIITAAKDGSELKTQYNIETGTWSFYHKGEKKPYNCGKCHTTGYQKEGHQDGKEGLIGTWSAPGVHCEACHGPAGDHIRSEKAAKENKLVVDTSAALCGKCHIRSGPDKIPASGGFIKHHEQFPETLAGPHNETNDVSCVSCHDPHKMARLKSGIRATCGSCHEVVEASFAKNNHGQVGIQCRECHMPRATKSAVKMDKFEGDVRSHLFRINTDAKAKMFAPDGKLAVGGFVTLDFACLNCHKNKDLAWAAKYAANMHGMSKK